MIFCHKETGLLVSVSVVENKKRVMKASGEVQDFVISKQLETESGQPCLQVDGGDVPCDLHSVDVMTNTGLVRLIRVE